MSNHNFNNHIRGKKIITDLEGNFIVLIFKEDGDIERLEEYKTPDRLVKSIEYWRPDKEYVIDNIYEYNEKKIITKRISCHVSSDSLGLKQVVNEYDDNGKILKKTTYDEDGETINKMILWERQGKRGKKEINYQYYKGKLTLSHIREWDENEDFIKYITCHEDGKTIASIETPDESGDFTKNIHYHADGKQIFFINKFNLSQMYKSKK